MRLGFEATIQNLFSQATVLSVNSSPIAGSGILFLNSRAFKGGSRNMQLGLKLIW